MCVIPLIRRIVRLDACCTATPTCDMGWEGSTALVPELRGGRPFSGVAAAGAPGVRTPVATWAAAAAACLARGVPATVAPEMQREVYWLFPFAALAENWRACRSDILVYVTSS